MDSEAYEILALAARYWFIILAALFVVKAWRITVRDNRNAKILRDWAGGAGCVGELVVLEDGKKQGRKSFRGARFPVPMEGLIGSGGTADIRIRHQDVRRKHVWFHYQPGRMVLTCAGRAQISCPMAQDGKRALRDGDQLVIGRLKLVMVFYDLSDAAAGQMVASDGDVPERAEGDFWE